MNCVLAVSFCVENAKSWPFEEATKILRRIEKNGKGCAVLETGYGPSGLPHIGTFGEVLRTTMVMNAFKRLSDIPCKLIVFSDDMDGLRKVPGNVPNQEMLHANLEKPLVDIPDPFARYSSFAHHNNAMLCKFLDSFGFEYEFKNAATIYKSGMFNEMLQRVLAKYEEIMNIMLPSLRDERKTTYSPFLPICPRIGHVLQVPIKEVDTINSAVVYKDPTTGLLEKVSILDGKCKLQWKADWGMRWAALGIDYEMSGKDLIDSVKLSSRICKVIGGVPPEGISYELFLDESGKKISKSKGNGISIDEWLKYAPQESLSYYMYQSPKRAKRLFLDVIPVATDEYIESINKFHNEPECKKCENSVFHIHNGVPPSYKDCLKFSMLLNLVQACNTNNEAILFGFIQKYADKYRYNEETMSFLKRLVTYAIAYYNDFVADTRNPTKPEIEQREALSALIDALASIQNSNAEADEIQSTIFNVGRKFYSDDLKKWFETLYQTLFGTTCGPRMGTFVKLYGIENSIQLINSRMSAH